MPANFCETGSGVTLASTYSDGKFTSGLWEIVQIGGLRRAVQVIDKSHLGLSSGANMRYCFGNLHSLSPMDVDVLVDIDNTTIFPEGSTTDGTVPVPLGELHGAADTSQSFVLTFATAAANGNTKLTFSGAVVEDSGIPLRINDVYRSQFKVHPDGVTFAWDGVATS